MTRLATGAVVLGAIALGAWLHEVDLEPKGAVAARRTSGGGASILGSADEWRYAHVEPATGAIEWDARGARAIPEGEGAWLVESPSVTIYGVAQDGRPVTPTAIASERARIHIPKSSDTIIHLEGKVAGRRGPWRFEAEEISAALPPGGGPGGRKKHVEGTLASDRPVLLVREEAPAVRLRGAGIRADAKLERATLLPPVRVEEARASFETAHPVELAMTGEEEVDVVFTGATEARYERTPPERPVNGVAPRGGRLRVKKPPRLAPGAPEPPLRGLSAAELPDARLFQDGKPLLRANTLTWIGERSTALLEGDVVGDLAATSTSTSTRTSTSSGTGTGTDVERLRESDWHVEADAAEIALGAAAEDLRLVLEGRGRQALLEGRGREPDDGWRIEGSRIEGDRRARRAAVTPHPGTVSRQLLVHGSDQIAAREIRYDEAALRAVATGEVVLKRIDPRSGAVAIEAHASEATVRFARPEEPESFELGGPGGAFVRIVPELVSTTRTAASGPPAPPPPPEKRRPIELRAARVVGTFAPPVAGPPLAPGSPPPPALATVRAEGTREAPVQVTALATAPAAERLTLTADAAVYDHRTGLVALEGERPAIARGPSERLSAREARFDTRTGEGTLRGAIRGKVLLEAPGDTEKTLFDFEAEEARVRLDPPGSGTGTGAAKDPLASFAAWGGVRLHDGAGNEVAADRCEYRSETRTVRLEGREGLPVRGKGKFEGTSDVLEYVVPEQAPKAGEKDKGKPK